MESKHASHHKKAIIESIKSFLNILKTKQNLKIMIINHQQRNINLININRRSNHIVKKLGKVMRYKNKSINVIQLKMIRIIDRTI
jgi:hypothetical protein